MNQAVERIHSRVLNVVRAVAEAWDYESEDGDSHHAPYYRVTISGDEDLRAQARALLQDGETLRLKTEAALTAFVALAQSLANMPDIPGEDHDFYRPLKLTARRLLDELTTLPDAS